MDSMDNEERAKYLIRLLKPCLRRSRNPDWSTLRYMTEWGSKTEEGLKAIITRVISGDDLPAIKD
jgi:superfamily I DNA and RNA helicase